jgi:hypothetical protein
MHSLVLAAAKFVVSLLCVGLAGVGLGAASDLVGAAGQGFFGLVESGFRGVGSLKRLLVQVQGRGARERGRTSFSPALVWKSLRNASDMFVVGLFDLWIGLV